MTTSPTPTFKLDPEVLAATVPLQVRYQSFCVVYYVNGAECQDCMHAAKVCLIGPKTYRFADRQRQDDSWKATHQGGSNGLGHRIAKDDVEGHGGYFRYLHTRGGQKERKQSLFSIKRR